MTVKATTIEWMHPSWRDLVIDHLVSNRAARRKFLSNCGVQGFLLALSSAGGAKGERTTPLLVESDDWQALNDSLPNVLASDYNASWQAITAVHEAILASRTPDGNIEHPRLLPLADELLKNLRSCWEAAPEQCTVQLLQRYYQVSEFFWPLPRSPDLRAIWDLYAEAAAEEIKDLDPEDVESEYPEISAWIDMAETITNNEPRFLRQVGFPDKYLDSFKELIPLLMTRVTYDFEFDTEDECSSEEHRLDDFTSLGWQIAKLVPKVAEAAKDVARSASTKEQRVTDLRHELEEAAKEAQRSSRAITSTPSPSSVEHVNITELFRDL